MSPRAAVVLAAVIVLVAVVVVLLGSRSGESGVVDGVGRSDVDPGGSALSVTGAPTAGASPAADGSPRAGGSPSAGGSPRAEVDAGGAAAGGGPSKSVGSVVVHVLGAVARPGVLTLDAGSRVSTAIDRAGGATPGADLERLNLARVLTDGERLYVPEVGETDIPAALDVSGAGVTGGAGASAGAGTGTGAGGSAGAPGAPGALVDLNTADQATLETLPGIGPSLAGRILAWRQEHGRFSAVEDLLDVSGIGDGRFAELRDRVRV